MAYAIFFFRDKSVEVGKIDWMCIEDQKKTCSEDITQCPDLEDEDGWMSVKWDKPGKKKKDGPTFFPAKVLMIGDNYNDLCQKREDFINGGDIWKKTTKRRIIPKSKWVENEDGNKSTKQQKTTKAACPAKEASNKMIEDLKKELMAKKAALEPTSESEESADEDPLPRTWAKAQQQIRELQAENKMLKEENTKEILTALKELPVVVEALKKIIDKLPTPGNASCSSRSTHSTDSPVCAPPSSSMGAPASPQVESDDMVSLVPGSDVKVQRHKLHSLRTSNPSVYIGDLAVLVFGREILSSSSLTGRPSGAHKDVGSKPQLDTSKLDAILGHALSKFPAITMQDVRRIIRKKCNNESYSKQAAAKKMMDSMDKD